MSERNPGVPGTADIAKAQARRLRNALAPKLELGHSQVLELIARTHGETSWGRMSAILDEEADSQAAVVPPSASQSPAGSPDVAQRPLPATAEPAGKARKHMGIEVEQRALQALWRGLQSAKPTVVSANARKLAVGYIREGVVDLVRFESWLDQLDTALGGMVFDMDVDNLLKAMEMPKSMLFRRPTTREKSVFGKPMLRLAQFASGLIFLEHLGFDTHPEVFVEPILPALKATRYLDGDEVSCLWYPRERRKFALTLDLVDPQVAEANLIQEDKVMGNGTRITVYRTRDDLPRIRHLRARH